MEYLKTLSFGSLCSARDALSRLVALGVLDGVDVIDNLYAIRDEIKNRAKNQLKESE